MKTFETEKHNIPEGATHYSNETRDMYFAWRNAKGESQVPSVDLEWMMFSPVREWKPIPQTNIETPEEKEAFDLIDTTPHQYEMGNFSMSNPTLKGALKAVDELDKSNDSDKLKRTSLHKAVDKVEWDGEGLPPVGVECEIYCPVNPVMPDGDKGWMKTEVVSIIDCGFGAETTVVYKTPWSAQWYVDAHPSSTLKFRKPETPQQREDRERLEAAIELHDLAQDAYFADDGGSNGSATWDKAPDRVKNMYLAIVDKTNYRKESE